MLNKLYSDWVLDISMGDDIPCFVPYDKETDTCVVGLNLITDRCPGNLVGVMCCAGQDAAEAWCRTHPDWYSRYCRMEESKNGS